MNYILFLLFSVDPGHMLEIVWYSFWIYIVYACGVHFVLLKQFPIIKTTTLGLHVEFELKCTCVIYIYSCFQEI